jgi:hypothetical protein
VRDRGYLLTSLLLLSCSTASETGLRLTVELPADLEVDQLALEVSRPSEAPTERLVPAAPATLAGALHVVLLVPESWGGSTVNVAITGRRRGGHVASARLSETVEAGVVLERRLALAPLCTDQCIAGARRCAANGASYQVCGQHDGDSCLEWGAEQRCSDAQACESSGCCGKTSAGCKIDAECCTGLACVGSTCGAWSLGGSSRFGSSGRDRGHGAAVDGSGNLYLTGFFEGTVDFGGGPLTSAGNGDVFVVSFDSTGAHRWSSRFGGSSSDDCGEDVAVDGSGNLYVTGHYSGTLDLGGGPLTSAGHEDIFIASFDPDGTHRWSKRLGGSSSDFGRAAAVDGGGNVYITGSFEGTTDLGGGPLTSAGYSDVFVASFGPGGAHRWSRRLGGPSWDYGEGVAADGGGNMYVTGFFQETADLGGGPLTSAGDEDIFVASFGPGGAHRWSKRLGSAGSDRGLGAAVDGSGNLYVTGSFEGTMDPGGGPLTSAGHEDIFVASFDPHGASRWTRSLGGVGSDGGEGVAAGKDGNLYATGYFRGIMDLGVGSPITSAGDTDIFVVSFGSTGAPRWIKRFGGVGADHGASIEAGGSGGLHVTGFFSGAVDLGGGPLTSAGGDDILVLRLAP